MTIISNLALNERPEMSSGILRGLNSHDHDIEPAWINEVERRAMEVESGEVEMFSGDQVMQCHRPFTQK